jgi:hypothetical protein
VWSGLRICIASGMTGDTVRASMSKRRVRNGNVRHETEAPNPKEAPPQTFTFQVGWNPLPPGVESATAQALFYFSDETENWSQRSMEKVLRRIQVPARENLDSGKCRLIVRTALAKLGIKGVRVDHFSDGRTETRELAKEPIFLDPHDTEFEQLFSEPDVNLRLDRAMMTAERVRNYLAYSAQMPLPLVGVCASREFLIPLRMECDPGRYGPPETKSLSDLPERWTQRLDAAHTRTHRLIDQLTPDEPVARAVSLVGEAIWTLDVEEQFFYAWRALEVIGNADRRRAIRQLSEGNNGPAQAYVSRNLEALLEKGQVKIDPVQMVEVSIDVRAPDVKPNPAKGYYDLRNAIAHGDVPGEKHLTILKKSGEILGLAYRLTEGALSERTIA